jgi:hypothetical protein
MDKLSRSEFHPRNLPNLGQRKAESIGGSAGLFWDFLLCSGDLLAFRLAGIVINDAAAAERFYTCVDSALRFRNGSFYSRPYLLFRLPTQVIASSRQ